MSVIECLVVDETLRYYEDNADEVTRVYEEVEFSRVIDRILFYTRPGDRLLDIGSGSGRDAARLLSLGLDVTILDGSTEMLKRATSLHPELAGRELLCPLPGRIPVPSERFQAATAWAVLMHFEKDALPELFSEIARVLKPGGLFAYSANTMRSGLDSKENDSRGRHFTCLHATEWESLHVAAGFKTLEAEETTDITGRPGIRWATYYTRKTSDEPQHTR